MGKGAVGPLAYPLPSCFSEAVVGLRRELVPHILFPVGGFTKSEIRAIAREPGLPVHDKPAKVVLR